MEKTIEIPEGYEARIEGNKVILERKKSENERIREVIESIIRVYGKTQGEWLAGYDMDTLVVHLRDAFARLERQKEQKPLSTEETELNSIAFLEQMGYTCIPSRKEQKPMYNLEIPAGDIAPAEEDGPFDEDEFLEGELSAFLQNYDKEYDDDAAVSDVAKHFYEIGKKQKEQKPAEWSKEDEKTLCGIEQCVYDNVSNIGTINKVRYIDWLESLRDNYKKCNSRWKPSKKQMEALEDAFRKDGGNEYRKVINSLYRDLEKLL